MVIEAPLSKYKKNNLRILIVIAAASSIWFAYDGYFNEVFIAEHTNADGIADSTLNFNQKAPPFLIGAAVLAGVFSFLKRNKKVVADENNLIVKGQSINYDSIEEIDKTHFEKKGYFIITYKDQTDKKVHLKLNDRTYDNLSAILDHLVAKIS